MAHPTPGLLPDDQELSLTLDRYQELMGVRVCLCSFNGIVRDDDAKCCECSSLWKQSYLDALAIALGRAEEMREQELGYHLAPKYINDEEYDDIKYPMILRRKHLIAIGSKKCDTVQLGYPLILSVMTVINDPVVISINPYAYTDISEIKVYYAGEDIEIHPSKVIIAGGTLTIYIPRCRLLKLTIDTNCDVPLYEDDANFVTTVDVKRCYVDLSDGMFKVWSTGCCDPCDTVVTETTELQYPRITDKRLSIVKYSPATYALGVWTRICCSSMVCGADLIRVSYLSGRRNSVQTEMETISLAHTLVPDSFGDAMDMCSGCWQYDREKSDLSTPYGDTRGAVNAWLSDSRQKVGFGTKSPRVR